MSDKFYIIYLDLVLKRYFSFIVEGQISELTLSYISGK